jgi:glutamate synthase domain-containing protein 2
MLSETMQAFLFTFLEVMSGLFIFAAGLGVLWLALMFISDISQTKHAVRRNYPVVGRFRYFFERLGEFFRQYFFAMDREELPFNRAQRSWVYRAAKDLDNTVAFGSTHDLRQTGTVLFVNTCPTGVTTHNKKLQRGLVPEDKAVRVANYAKNMVYEVGIIAHSCGVRAPRELRRFHARIVQSDGRSVPLDELYPPVVAPVQADRRELG